jgi:hypothetical protein
VAAPYSRSKFEEGLRRRLDYEKVKYEYEKESIPIVLDVPGYCGECGSRSVARKSRYTPDFFFPVWVVEAKGKFTARDRKRVLALKAARPDMKFAMLFQRDNWLTNRHVSRYSDWCREHGIPCSVGWFKEEWIR